MMSLPLTYSVFSDMNIVALKPSGRQLYTSQHMIHTYIQIISIIYRKQRKQLCTVSMSVALFTV